MATASMSLLVALFFLLSQLEQGERSMLDAAPMSGGRVANVEEAGYAQR
jgi:hypothetical protein